MQQILNSWMSMDFRRQITVVIATFVMFLAILTMSRLATAPSMSLLYAGLDATSAGDVVLALEQTGVAFEVRGDSIFVESRERDRLRMTLASDGLPANNGQGYELLDSLSGFGTTSQMFDAAYWRAKEGEIARTIASSSSISSARVHIASASSNPFQRGATPTASVAITVNGAGMSAAQAKAIRYLVASAVAGLAPDDVTVIDSNGGVIGGVEEDSKVGGADERALALRERVERLLEARVGPGNAVVEVSVDTVTETEEIRERRFDPEGRVAVSTDTEERTSNSNEEGGGNVTVASNLPDGDGASTETSTSQDTETRERVNYEVSETERAVTRLPGAIKRLTVAVLVNDTVASADGTDPQVRSEEELAALRELVESAVGFDEARGDVITIKSMSLVSVAPIGTEATSSIFDFFKLDLMSTLQMIILAIVTLILGLFVVKPILTPRDDEEILALPTQVSADDKVERADGSAAQPLDADESDFPQLDLNSPLPDLPGFPEMRTADDFGGMGVSGEDPVDRLKTMIGERQEETVEILRSWLEDNEERA